MNGQYSVLINLVRRDHNHMNEIVYGEKMVAKGTIIVEKGKK